MACLVCNNHVLTGRALLVAGGEIDGSGQFTVKDVQGIIHEMCLLDPEDGMGSGPKNLIGMVVKLPGNA